MPNSDDEDDGAPNTFGAPPMLMGFDDSSDNPLAGLQMPAHDITDNQPPTSDPMSQTGFLLSQSGAFKVSDFQIRKEGGLVPIGEEAMGEDHARPGELGMANQTVSDVNVESIKDLEMMGELGSGASGTVYKARHAATNTTVAVKAVTILEKSKRDQVVKELRIMRKHTLGARWLVGMYNAFYEDAKVFTVLEFMDAGSVEDLVKRHAAAGGMRDERELARLGRGMLEGLNYLHRQLHQVHRDLKPANVVRAVPVAWGWSTPTGAWLTCMLRGVAPTDARLRRRCQDRRLWHLVAARQHHRPVRDLCGHHVLHVA